MSKNNQLLVKEYKGKFYVFDVMAESWVKEDGEPMNPIQLYMADGMFDTRAEAHKFAHTLDDEAFGSEYGVVDEVLYKDGAKVTIVEINHEH